MSTSKQACGCALLAFLWHKCTANALQSRCKLLCYSFLLISLSMSAGQMSSWIFETTSWDTWKGAISERLASTTLHEGYKMCRNPCLGEESRKKSKKTQQTQHRFRCTTGMILASALVHDVGSSSCGHAHRGAQLCSTGPSLLEHDFVLTPMLRLIARITKLCWFENDQHRQIVASCKAFLAKGTPGHFCIGLMLLKAVVQVRRSILNPS
jgi:hypothetical protein